MIKNLKKISLFIIILFSLLSLSTKNVQATYKPNRNDFERLTIFPEYAKALIKLNFFTEKKGNLTDEEIKKVDRLFNSKTFENRMKLFYDLHLYGEAIITRKNDKEMSYYNILGSSLVEAKETEHTVKGTPITTTNKGAGILSITRDTNLYPSNLKAARFKKVLINEDGVTFLRIYNSNSLYEYLKKSCKESVNLEDVSRNRYCIDIILGINDLESVFCKDHNTPELLQQMYWNTKTNIKSPLMSTIENLPIEYSTYNDYLKNNLEAIKEDYYKKNPSDVKKAEKEFETIKKQAKKYLKVTSRTSFSTNEIENRLNKVYINNTELKTMKEIIELCNNKCRGKLNGFSYTYTREANQREIVTGGLGFLIEQLAEFSINIISAGYQYINKNFTNSSINAFSNNSIHIIWTIMRNLNNVFIILLFLVIIFSQLTGVGLSNYAIKKILPKLIIFVILINISYYLMLFAVDFSNILGQSIFDLLNVSASDITDNLTSTELIELFFGTAGLKLLLTLILIILNIPFVLISFVLSFILISLRTSLFILLTIFAPFGILSIMTINFNKIGKIWWHSLIIAIFIYPLLSMINGGSILAFKLIFGDSDSDLGFFMPIVMLFAVQSFGSFVALKSLTKLPLITSIPFLSAAIDKLSPSNNLKRGGKTAMALGGENTKKRYKAWRENKMAKGNSKFFRYQRSQAIRNQGLKRQEIINTLSNDEAEFILRNGNASENLFKDKEFRAKFGEKFGVSNFDKIQGIESPNEDIYLAALEKISKNDEYNKSVDSNVFLSGMAKAKLAGASEDKLEDIYKRSLENYKADTNYLAVAELENNRNYYGGIGNFRVEDVNNPNSDYNKARKESIKDVLSKAPIVTTNNNGEILSRIKSHMISDEHIDIMKDIYDDPNYSHFKKELQDKYNSLDPETQKRLSKVMTSTRDK